MIILIIINLFIILIRNGKIAWNNGRPAQPPGERHRHQANIIPFANTITRRGGGVSGVRRAEKRKGRTRDISGIY